MTGVWARRDHYALLEVERSASEKELRSAWALQSNVWHPDRFTGKLDTARPFAEERIAAINKAYEVLRNARTRRTYDLTLPADLDTEEWGDWPEPEQNAAEAWKQLASWLKDEDLGTGFERQMAFRAGDYLERRRELSPKQRPYAEAAWAIGVAHGWKPEL